MKVDLTKKKQKREMLLLRLPQEMKTELTHVAMENNVSVTYLVVAVLDTYLKESNGSHRARGKS